MTNYAVRNENTLCTISAYLSYNNIVHGSGACGIISEKIGETSDSLSLSFSLFLYIYICMYTVYCEHIPGGGVGNDEKYSGKYRSRKI